MKRTLVRLEDVADFANLSRAFWRAASRLRDRPDVAAYVARLDENLRQLGAAIREERAGCGRFRRFVVHDPKRRTIHAPEFADRVLHHALIAHLEPIFERAHSDDTFESGSQNRKRPSTRHSDPDLA